MKLFTLLLLLAAVSCAPGGPPTKALAKSASSDGSPSFFSSAWGEFKEEGQMAVDSITKLSTKAITAIKDTAKKAARVMATQMVAVVKDTQVQQNALDLGVAIATAIAPTLWEFDPLLIEVMLAEDASILLMDPNVAAATIKLAVSIVAVISPNLGKSQSSRLQEWIFKEAKVLIADPVVQASAINLVVKMVAALKRVPSGTKNLSIPQALVTYGGVVIMDPSVQQAAFDLGSNLFSGLTSDSSSTGQTPGTATQAQTEELKQFVERWTKVSDDAKWYVLSGQAPEQRQLIFNALTAEDQRSGRELVKKCYALPAPEQEARRKRGEAEWLKLSQANKDDF